MRIFASPAWVSQMPAGLFGVSARAWPRLRQNAAIANNSFDRVIDASNVNRRQNRRSWLNKCHLRDESRDCEDLLAAVCGTAQFRWAINKSKSLRQATAATLSRHGPNSFLTSAPGFAALKR